MMDGIVIAERTAMCLMIFFYGGWFFSKTKSNRHVLLLIAFIFWLVWVIVKILFGV